MRKICQMYVRTNVLIYVPRNDESRFLYTRQSVRSTLLLHTHQGNCLRHYRIDLANNIKKTQFSTNMNIEKLRRFYPSCFQTTSI